MLNEGDKFPDFELLDQDGERHSLGELLKDRLIVYFYPKDDTSGCTAEACGFRDMLPNFKGAQVIGISPDAPKSHRKFVDKYGLNFTLLADVDHQLAEKCGIWVEKSMYGRKYMGVERTTFLLDSSGVITKIWRKVKPDGHAEEVQSAL
ncbi:MAG: peroxiredoxin [Armatimonadetes bacterium 55-13]|nr:MAG: peroxiredoxin [Armatimonadetes bacterium 55-13]